jgi:hypothetical protein
MVPETVTLEELLATPQELVDRIVGEMRIGHREFFVGFKAGTPDWASSAHRARRRCPL